MKLIDRYNRVSLMTTIAVIIVTGVVYYFTISYILTGQVDNDLRVEENEIFDHVKINDRLPQVFSSDHLDIRFHPLTKDTVVRRFLNTSRYNEQEHEAEAVRTLVTSVTVSGRPYRVVISQSTVETEYLIRFIFLITLGIVFLLLILLLLINRLLMRKLWQPFYRTLQQIKLFNLADRNVIKPVETNIDEFRELDREVAAMSHRALNEYQTLKAFTENASHELMTPLAVIISKLDTLMQSGDITDKQGPLIAEVYDTVGRLKKLNRSMLLLARIENKLMPEPELVDLYQFLQEKLAEFQELLADKDLTLAEDMQACHISINKDLLSIMVNNLLANAILHNYSGGRIVVKLNERQLAVCNTGVKPPLDQSVIFQRFKKSAESDGTGLGLTLVKQICDNYGYPLNYRMQDDLHSFFIQFPVNS